MKPSSFRSWQPLRSKLTPNKNPISSKPDLIKKQYYPSTKMKIKQKLILAFTINTIMLLVLSMVVIYILNAFEGKRKDVTESFKLSDALNEAKYNLTWDKQLVMETLASVTIEEVDEQWNFHQTSIKGFDDNINVITEVTGHTD